METRKATAKSWCHVLPVTSISISMTDAITHKSAHPRGDGDAAVALTDMDT